MKKLGQRVKITAGMPEFIGKTGTIIDVERLSKNEPPYYRVELDEPVEFFDIGVVTDDIWQGQFLRNIRS